MKPFDYIKTLSKTKDYQDDLVGYDPYLTNTSFSLYADTIHHANKMNLAHGWGASERMQYDYYYYAVREAHRFTKWPKRKENDENLAYVQEYYKYDLREAKKALSLLTDSQIEKIKEALNKGGMK